MSRSDRIAISDSSPLILYSAIGQLHILNALFDELWIPPAVWGEVVEDDANRRGSSEVRAAEWIRVQRTSIETGASTDVRLDRGESEVIALALELDRRYWVILDDLAARRHAESVGLRVIGSAGLLLRLKRRGVIPHIHPLLTELEQAGLYLGDQVLQRLISAADESI